MNYSCPFCQDPLLKDDCCQNTSCPVNYTYSFSEEEYETDLYGIHFRIEVNLKDFSIFIENDDVTDVAENFFSIEELRLQNKTKEQILILIDKIKKFHSMKAFW